MNYDQVFARFMVQEIEKIDNDYHAKEITIYVPKDLKEPLMELFPKAYDNRLHIVTGNYIRASFSKIFGLLKSRE